MRLPNGACRGHIRFRSAHEELRLYFLFMNSARILVLVYSCPLFIFKKKKERVSLVVEQRRTSTLFAKRNSLFLIVALYNGF